MEWVYSFNPGARTGPEWRDTACHVLWVFVEHDRQVLVDRQQFAEGILLHEFPRSAIRQHVAESPVGVVRPDQTAAALHPRLVLISQNLPTQIAAQSQFTVESPPARG